MLDRPDLAALLPQQADSSQDGPLVRGLARVLQRCIPTFARTSSTIDWAGMPRCDAISTCAVR
jgi:hypothetical protein